MVENIDLNKINEIIEKQEQEGRGHYFASIDGIKDFGEFADSDLGKLLLGENYVKLNYRENKLWEGGIAKIGNNYIAINVLANLPDSTESITSMISMDTFSEEDLKDPKYVASLFLGVGNYGLNNKNIYIELMDYDDETQKMILAQIREELKTLPERETPQIDIIKPQLEEDTLTPKKLGDVAAKNGGRVDELTGKIKGEIANADKIQDNPDIEIE